MYWKITKANLKQMLKKMQSESTRIVAPFEGEKKQVDWQVASDIDAINLDLSYVNTHMPLKEYFFPKTEAILEFKYKKNDVQLKDIEHVAVPTFIWGARACDAHSLHILTSVFEWDYKDKFFLERLEKSIVATLLCQKRGEFCYCDIFVEKNNLLKGSDLVFLEERDGYNVIAVTAKARDLVQKYKEFFVQVEGDVDALLSTYVEKLYAPSSDRKNIDFAALKKWLNENFDSELFEKEAMKCIGCATCAFLCPTCHCFDIVDEKNGSCGQRRKNWDCCAFRQFTQHAQGHNPRENQGQRWRQRMLHKFSVYEDKFGLHACVGCGRCIEYCPAGMNMLEMFEKMNVNKK